MKKLLMDPDKSKDLLYALGAFTFLSGLFKLCVPTVRDSMLSVKIFASLVILALIWYVSMYVLLHVVRPIVQLYYPDFTLPEIDVNHKIPSKWWHSFQNPAFLLMLALYLRRVDLSRVIFWRHS